MGVKGVRVPRRLRDMTGEEGASTAKGDEGKGECDVGSELRWEGPGSVGERGLDDDPGLAMELARTRRCGETGLWARE